MTYIQPEAEAATNCASDNADAEAEAKTEEGAPENREAEAEAEVQPDAESEAETGDGAPENREAEAEAEAQPDTQSEAETEDGDEDCILDMHQIIALAERRDIAGLQRVGQTIKKHITTLNPGLGTNGPNPSHMPYMHYISIHSSV